MYVCVSINNINRFMFMNKQLLTSLRFLQSSDQHIGEKLAVTKHC